MPYFVDLDKRARKLMQMTVKPYGWIYGNNGGIEIEYGNVYLNNHDPEPSMCMRVKGTTHCWCWFQHNFYHLANNNYADFFTKQLEEFRLDFLLWIKDPNIAKLPWVGEYYEMFKGKFYAFSPDEEREFEEAKKQFLEDQKEIDRVAAEKRRENELYRNGVHN